MAFLIYPHVRQWNAAWLKRLPEIWRIYRYATALDEAGKHFELKVSQGGLHGFMIENAVRCSGLSSSSPSPRSPS